MRSTVWPVNSALSRNISFLMTANCSAWIAMSAALPVMPAERLVHQDPGVRQRVALALGARGEQELTHRRGHAHRVGGDVARRQHHGVVDRHARR